MLRGAAQAAWEALYGLGELDRPPSRFKSLPDDGVDRFAATAMEAPGTDIAAGVIEVPQRDRIEIHWAILAFVPPMFYNRRRLDGG